MTLDRWRYGNKWDRVVPGLNVVIPWPTVEAPEFEAKAADSLRESVEERTFYYGLLSPPMPETVVDELRNKYSRFRTRHEDWYLQQKEAEAEAKQRQRETIRSMQTPVQEFNEMKRAERAMAGEPELTEDMLEKIGEVMAKKKAAALEQAGVSEVSSGTQSPSPQ
jgi:large subunit ribosomal protein L24